MDGEASTGHRGAGSPFRDECRKHARPTEELAWRLRFDLAQNRRTREAVQLIERILTHPRLSRRIFTHPISGRLPLVLVLKRSGCEEDALQRVILAMQPYMAGYGRYQAEFALDLLGDPDALARAMAILDQ